MTFAVCDFAQNTEYLVTMVKVHNAGSKVFHWTVIVALEIHGWLPNFKSSPKNAFA